MLLFLFVLRLQSWREGFKLKLGLSRNSYVGDSERGFEVKDPARGLLRASDRRIRSKSGAKERDWMWMILGFVLSRGTWMGWIAERLQACGLNAVGYALGSI
jgi:hypothetical protein